MSGQYRWFVGIDRAMESHEVCIVDGDGGVVDRKTIKHTGAGTAQLVKRLEELTGVEPGLAAVGIEAPRGAMFELSIAEIASVLKCATEAVVDRDT